jgi:hypothetical protein
MRALELLGLGSVFETIANISQPDPLWFRVVDGKTGSHITNVSSEVSLCNARISQWTIMDGFLIVTCEGLPCICSSVKPHFQLFCYSNWCEIELDSSKA